MPGYELDSAESLMAQARRDTGLEDFGGDEFVDGLALLMSDLAEQRDILPERLPRIREHFLSLLTNRLWAAKDVAENPGIAAERLLPPVAIVSLPRCGTTKLQRILGSSDHFQHLRYWHTYMYARIPGLQGRDAEVRRLIAKDHLDWREAMSPELQQGHPMAVDESEEEMFMLEGTFRTQMTALNFNAPGFGQWFAQCDPAPTYDRLLSNLKYLQWQFHRDRPRPWLLKSPMHIGSEQQLQRIFPDMKIIVPHRAPETVIPSMCRLVEQMSAVYYGVGRRKATYGPAVLYGFADALRRHIEWRERNPQVQVLDLGYAEIARDSIATARKVHDFAGVELTADAMRCIAVWDAENPFQKHGRNSYALADFGLSEAQVREAFAPYRRRFAAYLQ